MDKELLKKYEGVELKLKALETEKEVIRNMILDQMVKSDLKKTDGDLGSFTVGSRKSWTYSDKIETLTEKVKLAKAKEEKNGTAKAVETNYLMYKMVK